MTKSPGLPRTTQWLMREPRPFLHLQPARLPLREVPADARGIERLEAAIEPQLGQLVRSLVDLTITRQNRNSGRSAQPIQVAVLNRRRRAARSWLLAIAGGHTDAGTRHLVATQWLPLLCGTGPERRHLAAAARELVEFVRGAITACIFDEAAENLLPHARALFVLEATLAVHLAAAAETTRPAPV